MALEVHVNVLADAPEDIGPLLERAAVVALEDAGLQDATLSLTLLDDADIAALNGEYLDRDGPTDVIAFALHDPGESPLGDVYVGVDRAAEEASARHIPLRHELARLAIHGTLHVLGHEHPDGAERESSAMWSLQERLVERLTEAL